MKVLFDYQALQQSFGGVSRYYYELYRNFSADESVEVFLPVRYSYNKYFCDIIPPSLAAKNRLQRFARRQANKLLAVHTVSRKGIDIIHPGYYNPYLLPFRKNAKVVCTVHDMIHELYPQYHNDARYVRHKKRMIYDSDHVIAISENTKRDILALYPDVPESKISVIYLSQSFAGQTPEKPAAAIPEKYVLFIGTRILYKGFDTFCDAVIPLLVERKDVHVVCVGGGAFSMLEKETMRKAQLENRFMQIGCNDRELLYLYQNAACFVFPSRYEGFGIPVLESFFARCPTILCNSSSLPEIGMGGAVYFEPGNSDELREAVRNVMDRQSLRDQIIEAADRRVAEFSWEQTAAQTIEIYRKISGGT